MHECVYFPDGVLVLFLKYNISFLSKTMMQAPVLQRGCLHGFQVQMRNVNQTFSDILYILVSAERVAAMEHVRWHREISV